MSDSDEDRFIRTRPCPETSEPKRGKFYRLRLEWEPNYGLVEVADEQVTSLSEGAQRIEGGEHYGFDLTPDEARWLHGALGELLAMWDAPPAPADGGK